MIKQTNMQVAMIARMGLKTKTAMAPPSLRLISSQNIVLKILVDEVIGDKTYGYSGVVAMRSRMRGR